MSNVLTKKELEEQTTEQLIDKIGWNGHHIIRDGCLFKWQETNVRNIAKELSKRIGIDADKLVELMLD